MDTGVYFSKVFGSEKKQKLKTTRNNSRQRFNRAAPTNKNFTLEQEKAKHLCKRKEGLCGQRDTGRSGEKRGRCGPMSSQNRECVNESDWVGFVNLLA